MVKKLLKPWPRRIFLTRISTAVIIVTALLSIAIVILSLYGNSVGNFVVSIEKETRLQLSLSETGDFTDNATSRLSSNGLSNVTHATYANIPNDITDFNGEHNDELDRRYTAYTFYLMNMSPIAISYIMTITIDRVVLDVDSAVRVMVVADDYRSIYAKVRKDGQPESHLGADVDKPYTTTPFLSDTTVCQVDTEVFGEGQIRKYTVVMWLEGYDEECVDDIKGGSIQLSMKFEATQG